MTFYEIRRYQVFPGKMDEWVTFMEKTIIPFQISRGMLIAGSFRGEEDETTYIWIRRFASEAERKRLYEAVYEDDEWKQIISPRVGELINRDSIQVTRVIPTSQSVLQ